MEYLIQKKIKRKFVNKKNETSKKSVIKKKSILPTNESNSELLQNYSINIEKNNEYEPKTVRKPNIINQISNALEISNNKNKTKKIDLPILTDIDKTKYEQGFLKFNSSLFKYYKEVFFYKVSMYLNSKKKKENIEIFLNNLSFLIKKKSKIFVFNFLQLRAENLRKKRKKK